MIALCSAFSTPLQAVVIYTDNFDDNFNTGWTYLDRNGPIEIANALWVETGGRLEQQTENYDFPRSAISNSPTLGTIALSPSGVVGGRYSISLTMDSLEEGNGFQDQVVVFGYEDVDNFNYIEILSTPSNDPNNRVVINTVVAGERTERGRFLITFNHDPVDVLVTIDTLGGEVSASYDGGEEMVLATELTLAAGMNGVGSNNDAFAIDDFTVTRIPDPTVEITSFASIGGGIWELTLEGARNTAFEFRSSTTLDFTPGMLVENLSQGDPSESGTIIGTNDAVILTDSAGIATVRMSLLGEPADFVRAQEVEIPALLDESFDLAAALPTGWTSNGPSNGTDWEVGIPSGGEGLGPDSAFSLPNCAGTNLSGFYTENANVSLTSPSFFVPLGQDLVLSYQQYIDTDLLGAVDDDAGTILILDADSAEVLFSVPEIEGEGQAWTSEELTIPDVSGRNIQIEFNFTSNAGTVTSTDVWSGFYVDDVRVGIVEAQPEG